MAVSDARSAPGASRLRGFVAELDQVFGQYWGGQREVVKTFFGGPRPREQLITWLEGQVHKEIQSVPFQARRILEMCETLDDQTERSELMAEAYELADEVQHFCLLADVLEMLTGRRRPAREFPGSTSPEALALRAVRNTYRGQSVLADAVAGFGSTGGGTAFSSAGVMADGGPVERQLARAFQVIYEQELHHYHHSRIMFDSLVLTADPADYPFALEYARELARSHFMERNALFSYPLSPERIAEIDAGIVTPYMPPPLAASH